MSPQYHRETTLLGTNSLAAVRGAPSAHRFAKSSAPHPIKNSLFDTQACFRRVVGVARAVLRFRVRDLARGGPKGGPTPSSLRKPQKTTLPDTNSVSNGMAFDNHSRRKCGARPPALQGGTTRFYRGRGYVAAILALLFFAWAAQPVLSQLASYGHSSKNGRSYQFEPQCSVSWSGLARRWLAGTGFEKRHGAGYCTTTRCFPSFATQTRTVGAYTTTTILRRVTKTAISWRVQTRTRTQAVGYPLA